VLVPAQGERTPMLITQSANSAIHVVTASADPSTPGRLMPQAHCHSRQVRYRHGTITQIGLRQRFQTKISVATWATNMTR
jgi:hypothetical protein